MKVSPVLPTPVVKGLSQQTSMVVDQSTLKREKPVAEVAIMFWACSTHSSCCDQEEGFCKTFSQLLCSVLPVGQQSPWLKTAWSRAGNEPSNQRWPGRPTLDRMQPLEGESPVTKSMEILVYGKDEAGSSWRSPAGDGFDDFVVGVSSFVPLVETQGRF